jgi:hypothetical protein
MITASAPVCPRCHKSDYEKPRIVHETLNGVEVVKRVLVCKNCSSVGHEFGRSKTLKMKDTGEK